MKSFFIWLILLFFATNVAAAKPVDEKIQTTRFRELVMSIPDKYDERLSRYEEFLQKARTRLDKLAAKRPDVEKNSFANLRAFLSTAQENINDAKRIVALARVRLNALDYTQDKKTLMKQVRTEVTTMKQTMTKLHTSMSQAVKTIRGLSKENL